MPLLAIGQQSEGIGIYIETPGEMEGQDANESVGCILPIEKNAYYSGGNASFYCDLERVWSNHLIDGIKEDGVVLLQLDIDSRGQISNVQVNPKSIVKSASHLPFVKKRKVLRHIAWAIEQLNGWGPGEIDGLKVKNRMIFLLKFPYVSKCGEE